MCWINIGPIECSINKVNGMYWDVTTSNFYEYANKNCIEMLKSSRYIFDSYRHQKHSNWHGSRYIFTSHVVKNTRTNTTLFYNALSHRVIFMSMRIKIVSRCFRYCKVLDTKFSIQKCSFLTFSLELTFNLNSYHHIFTRTDI